MALSQTEFEESILAQKIKILLALLLFEVRISVTFYLPHLKGAYSRQEFVKKSSK